MAHATGIALRVDRPPRRASPSPCVSFATGPRPEPGSGVLETVRVLDGRGVALISHLARLRASSAELGLPWSVDLPAAVRRAAAAVRDGALRVVLGLDGWRVEARPLPGAQPMGLLPVKLPGGLGAHKWSDRRLIDALSEPGATPLFCDLDGTVLEAGYAAVMIVEGDRVLAPPLDGRILPSLSRARVLAAAGGAVRIESFTLDRARHADAVLLSSSLRGLHVGLLEGGPDSANARAWAQRLNPVVACVAAPPSAKIAP